jgi:exopolyphosphatase / guanosine-5'-triphosphate,3'-diphosphate pyrophosphatase
MPVAILDFGTNTFNLLIAEKNGKSFRVLYDGKEPVKLGMGGINKGVLTPEAMERGFTAIANHMKTIESFGEVEIRAFATSAMRNAANGKAFAKEIRERFGFRTKIIDGDEEAALIYSGIRESVEFGSETAIIMDIGGGSVEFIICNAEGIFWKHSFELGMARIIEKFPLSDPVTETEITTLEQYFAAELNALFEQARRYPPSLLVGASGTFDTLAAMATCRFKLRSADNSSSMEIDTAHYEELHHLLLHSTAEERLLMPGMEPVRVEMIVPATIFINFVRNSCNLRTIVQSRYALKEGAMARLIKHK